MTCKLFKEYFKTFREIGNADNNTRDVLKKMVL